MQTIIFDTETTGREKSDGPAAIIEAAYIEVSSTRNLAEVSSYQGYFNPAPTPIEWGAIATHHILPHELLDSPPSSEFRLPDGLEYMIGHNVDYDWNVAGEPNVRRICTLAMSRWLWPDLDSHTQSALYYWIHSLAGDAMDMEKARKTLHNAHSALWDVRICKTILQHELHVIRERGFVIDTWEQLWQLSEKARIPTVMAFGKHKGEKIADIPGSYKAWLLKQEDTDPYLRIALIGGVER